MKLFLAPASSSNSSPSPSPRNPAATEEARPFLPASERSYPISTPTSRKTSFCWAAFILCLCVAGTILSILFVFQHDDTRRLDDPSTVPRKVLDGFPDPGLLAFNGSWYAFGTNPMLGGHSVGPHVPVAVSRDFVTWTLSDLDALPIVARWETERDHWAPDVMQRADGKFVLYYTGESRVFKRHHCVGAAISSTTDPTGPYIPYDRDYPLACQMTYGGAIDPSPFKDIDGKMYVIYKADGNSVGRGGVCNNGIEPLMPTPLMLLELEADGVTPATYPLEIFDRDASDGPLVEAPNIVRSAQGVYFLFFSSHCYDSRFYDVKYATSTNVKGPYVRAKRPLLRSGDFALSSPGGATVSQDGTKIVFHANCETGRCMFVGGVHMNGTVIDFVPL